MDKQNPDTRSYNIEVTFHGAENRLSIGKDVIRALGAPSHVSIKMSDSHDAISISPCDEDDAMAFKVPERFFSDHRCIMRINSMRFVHGIMRANHMDIGRTYKVKGKYMTVPNAAVFCLADGVVVRAGNEARVARKKTRITARWIPAS